jgi:hypothetical protein
VFTSSGFLKVFPPDEQERLLFLAARQGCRARMSGSKPLIHLQVKFIGGAAEAATCHPALIRIPQQSGCNIPNGPGHQRRRCWSRR